MIWYQRNREIDIAIRDGEALALLPSDEVIRLSPLPTLLVERAAGGALLEELVEAAVSRFGPPPADDAVAVVRGVLKALCDAGVLIEVCDD